MASLNSPVAGRKASMFIHHAIDDDIHSVSSSSDVIQEIWPENIPNTIYTQSPEGRFRMGIWSVIGLVVNRVIGMPKSGD